MIKLKKIVEEKNVGILYHLMDGHSLEFNLKNDVIGNGKNHLLSFTRNKNLNTIEGNDLFNKYAFKFVIDGNKLSNKYKISPVRDNNYKSDESEERVIGTIKDIGKYIIEIWIMKKKFDNYYDGEKKEILDIINRYIEKYTNIKVGYK